MPLSGGAELDFGVLPNLVAGGAQSLEHLLAGSGVLPNVGPVEAATANPAITHVLSIYSLFERDSPVGVVNAAISKPSAFDN